MGSPDKAGPSRAWFILPSILLLTGALLGGLSISAFVDFVRPDLRAYQRDSFISVPRNGITLYAADGTTGPDDLRCAATGRDEQIRLRPASGSRTLRHGSETFIAIASSPKGLPAGRYLISCERASGGADVRLYVSPRVDLADLDRPAVVGVAAVFLGFCSVVLFAILALLRRRSRAIPTVAVRTSGAALDP